MERELEFPFERDRYRHELVLRHGDVCLVERENLLTGSRHWEVVVVQHRPARTLPNGVRVEAGEAYPSSAQWGEAGWTYTRRLEADARMAILTVTRSRTAP